MSRSGINLFSFGAFVVAAIIWTGGLWDLSGSQIDVLAVPGTVLAVVGLIWAFKKEQRKWFAWTAFGLIFPVTLVAFGVLLVELGLLPKIA